MNSSSRKIIDHDHLWASLVAQVVKTLPETQETQVRSLGQKDPLEKGMATHSSTLAWKIPWTEEPGRLQSSSIQFSRSVVSDTMDCSPPGSSFHGVPQASILEWVAIPFSRGSF